MVDEVSSLTEPQANLLSLLGKRSSLMAALYRRIISCLAEPFESPDRTLIIAHCVRELVNNLPDILGAEGKLPEWEDTSGPTRRLAQAHHEHLQFIARKQRAEEDVQVAIVEMHEEVYLCMIAVVEATQKATGNAYVRLASVATGVASKRMDPTVRRFQGATKYFQGLAHLSKGETRAQTNEQLLYQLSIIENVLISRLGNFFDDAGSRLQEIARMANKRGSRND